MTSASTFPLPFGPLAPSSTRIRLDPADADGHAEVDLRIAGKGGVTKPSPCRVAAGALTAGEAAALGPDAAALLGPVTPDGYLNEKAYWWNVPWRVWGYHLGGYQVYKKWLSYPERPLFGRALTTDEVTHVRDTARRIASLLLLTPSLDANYAAPTADAFPWPAAAVGGSVQDSSRRHFFGASCVPFTRNK